MSQIHPFPKILRRNLLILACILVAMLGAGLWAGLRHESSLEPIVDYFDIDQQLFVAESHRIKRMEVWAVPEGATNEAGWKAIGAMKRMSHWFSWAQWELAIPKEPAPYMQIMVRAYDEHNVEVDRVSLPYIGDKVVHEALWGNRE